MQKIISNVFNQSNVIERIVRSGPKEEKWQLDVPLILIDTSSKSKAWNQSAMRWSFEYLSQANVYLISVFLEFSPFFI